MIETAIIGVIATGLAFRIFRMTTGAEAGKPLNKKKFLLHVGGLGLLLAYCLLSPLVTLWLRGRAAENEKAGELAVEAERLLQEGKLAEAADLASQSVALASRRFGPDDLGRVLPLEALASCRGSQKNFGESEELRKQALAIRVKVHGPDSPEAAAGENALGELYHAMKRYDDAEATYKQVLSRTERVIGQVPAVLPLVLENLARLCDDTARPEEAKAYRARARTFKPSR
jgi:tetratricopeptide (TPR) repeat protein